IINVNGTGELVHNTTPSSVPAVGDTFEVNGSPLAAGSLSFTSLTSSVSASAYGQAVTLTAAVRSSLNGAGTPTGSVQLQDASTGAILGTGSFANGCATFTLSSRATGSNALTAPSLGDRSFTFSLDTLIQPVTPDATSPALASSVTPPTLGQAVTFTAT